MTILIFVNKDQSIILISFSGLSFFSVMIQAFYALRSLNTSFTAHNYPKHRTYLLTKLAYLCINSLKICFKTDDISDKKDFCLFFIDLAWTFCEVYWAMVLFLFCYKVKVGFYELFEGFLDEEVATNRALYRNAIVLEIWGARVRNFKGNPKDLDPCYPVIIEKKTKNLAKEGKNLKKVKFIWFFLIFARFFRKGFLNYLYVFMNYWSFY